MIQGKTAPTRPVLRYFGGKWRLAPWIISHFPPHRVYVEPFGGAASVMMRKPRAYSEIYNDLNAELVTLFRVLRSDRAQDLVQALRLTPFARAEFELAYEIATDPVEIARRLVVRSFFGYGGGLSIERRPTSFRAVNHKSGSVPGRQWANHADALTEIIERLRGVVIENRPALDVIRANDGPETLHYVDPPYPHDTRSLKQQGGKPHHRYAHEMSDTDHQELLATLGELQGAVIISGYQTPIYDAALAGWHRRETEAVDDSAGRRREVIWMNFDPAALPPPGELFAHQPESTIKKCMAEEGTPK